LFTVWSDHLVDGHRYVKKMMTELTIEAGRSHQQYFKDLWQYRELFWFLAWRDILVRYKQTLIGITWCLIHPLVTMVVFTILFGKLAKFPSDGVPYPILVYAATLPWQFFATTLSQSSNSVVGNANMISKIYFPRIIVPFSSAVVGLIDFCISFLILMILGICLGIYPSWKIACLPFFILLALFASTGAGLWFAALNVKYRDVRILVPFILQIGLYLSPVGFSSSIVPEKWRLLYALNPMVSVIDGFRWAILDNSTTLRLGEIGMAVMVVMLIWISGVWFFRRTEKAFADVI
jgi:lipopolysaccharide transport system permease protein